MPFSGGKCLVVFSSPTFLFIFLPVVLIVYHALPQRSPARNWWLLAASIVFYFWGAGSAIVAITFVSISSFFGAYIAWLLTGKGTIRPRRTAYTAIVLIVVLVPLVAFKYVPQLASYQISGLGPLLGSLSAASWTLPLGISFFTFHAMSFVIDSARAGKPLTRSFGAYLLYLFLFPHQIAGPIVRYSEIGSQIESFRQTTARSMGYGITRFTWGLAKKVLIADNCGTVANAFFDNSFIVGQVSAPGAWLGALAYALQIYFDFSGYSDMAIGLAMMFGFQFPENFRSPYTAASVTEFWRRWHITLTRWFRDYVYIPLGGNRHGLLVEYGALLLVFLLTSLWHGALAGFLIWGCLHSGALLFERITGLRNAERFVALRRVSTFVFVVIAWVPFRASEAGTSIDIWRSMVQGPWDFTSPIVLVSLTPITVGALVVGLLSVFATSKRTGFETIFGTDGPHELLSFRWKRAWLFVPVGLVVTLAMVMWSGFSPFLYFQF